MLLDHGLVSETPSCRQGARGGNNLEKTTTTTTTPPHTQTQFSKKNTKIQRQTVTLVPLVVCRDEKFGERPREDSFLRSKTGHSFFPRRFCLGRERRERRRTRRRRTRTTKQYYAIMEKIRELEDAFLNGCFHEAWKKTRQFLLDEVFLTPYEKSVQRAAVILGIQCCFELQLTTTTSSTSSSSSASKSKGAIKQNSKSSKSSKTDPVDTLVCKQYGDLNSAPYDVFVVWLKLRLYEEETERACRAAAVYLKSNAPIDQHEQAQTSKVSRLTAMHNQEPLTQEQFDSLFEILVVDGLVVLGRFAEAKTLIKHNQHLSDGSRKVCAYVRECVVLMRPHDVLRCFFFLALTFVFNVLWCGVVWCGVIRRFLGR
jgi:hypothetical protein